METCPDLAIQDGTLCVHVRLLGLAQNQLHTVQVGHLQHVTQLGPVMQTKITVTKVDTTTAARSTEWTSPACDTAWICHIDKNNTATKVDTTIAVCTGWTIDKNNTATKVDTTIAVCTGWTSAACDAAWIWSTTQHQQTYTAMNVSTTLSTQNQQINN